MGRLGEALRHLEVRPAAPSAPPPIAAPATGAQTPADSPIATSEFEPLALDYADDLAADIFSQATVAGPEPIDVAAAAPPIPDSNSAIEQVLDFAETAIQAVAQADEHTTSTAPIVCDSCDENAAIVEPLLAQHCEPTGAGSSGPSSTIPIDRAYSRLWDNVSAALTTPPPWSIVAVSPDHSASAEWMLPAAVAFAQRYASRILLLDASRNIGNNKSLGELFGSIPEYGFTDVLRRVVQLSEAVQKTSVPRVELLSHGIGKSHSISPASRYADLFAELKREYQLILIRADNVDDPHVRPVFSTADGALLVIELGRTERAAAETASNALYLAGARLLGCIARS